MERESAQKVEDSISFLELLDTSSIKSQEKVQLNPILKRVGYSRPSKDKNAPSPTDNAHYVPVRWEFIPNPGDRFDYEDYEKYINDKAKRLLFKMLENFVILPTGEQLVDSPIASENATSPPVKSLNIKIIDNRKPDDHWEVPIRAARAVQVLDVFDMILRLMIDEAIRASKKWMGNDDDDNCVDKMAVEGTYTYQILSDEDVEVVDGYPLVVLNMTSPEFEKVVSFGDGLEFVYVTQT